MCYTTTVSEVIFFTALTAIIQAPAVLIVFDIIFFVRKKRKPVFELLAFAAGAVYTFILYILCDMPVYDKPLNIYDSKIAHEPFSTKYFFIIIIVAIIGFAAYFLLKFKRTFPPLVKAILLAFMYICCIYNIIWMIQLLCGANPLKSEQFPDYRLGMSGISFMPLMLCIVPVIYLFHCGHLMWQLVKDCAQEQGVRHYDNPVLQALNDFLLKGANILWVGAVMILPVLCIVIIILCFFGQQPDSLLYSFTKTSDWILSKEISPPPVAYDSHYLCTVSLRGHKKLVKPLRYGIRKGEKIVVNRQLCVANAFEELIMEKTPQLHKAIRSFYDTYGYPVSKHINNAWSADFVYIIMKPLEWFFVAVLYMADLKPEDRICRQYLPKQ